MVDNLKTVMHSYGYHSAVVIQQAGFEQGDNDSINLIKTAKIGFGPLQETSVNLRPCATWNECGCRIAAPHRAL